MESTSQPMKPERELSDFIRRILLFLIIHGALRTHRVLANNFITRLNVLLVVRICM